MPIYPYRCVDCRHRFERTEPMDRHGTLDVSCPECRSTKVEQVPSTFYPRTASKT